jgi:hypothetical protein
MSVAAVPDGRLSTLPARPLPFRGASKGVGRQLNRRQCLLIAVCLCRSPPSIVGKSPTLTVSDR